MTDLLPALGVTAASVVAMYVFCVRLMHRRPHPSKHSDPAGQESAQLRREVANLRRSAGS